MPEEPRITRVAADAAKQKIKADCSHVTWIPRGQCAVRGRLAAGKRMGAKEEQGWQPCPLRVEPRPAQGERAQGSQPESQVPDFHDFRQRMEQSGTGRGPLAGSSQSKAESQVAKVVRMVQRQLPPGYPEAEVRRHVEEVRRSQGGFSRMTLNAIVATVLSHIGQGSPHGDS